MLWAVSKPKSNKKEWGSMTLVLLPKGQNYSDRCTRSPGFNGIWNPHGFVSDLYQSPNNLKPSQNTQL